MLWNNYSVQNFRNLLQLFREATQRLFIACFQLLARSQSLGICLVYRVQLSVTVVLEILFSTEEQPTIE